MFCKFRVLHQAAKIRERCETKRSYVTFRLSNHSRLCFYLLVVPSCQVLKLVPVVHRCFGFWNLQRFRHRRSCRSFVAFHQFYDLRLRSHQRRKELHGERKNCASGLFATRRIAAPAKQEGRKALKRWQTSSAGKTNQRTSGDTHTSHRQHKKFKCKELSKTSNSVPIDSATHVSPNLDLLQMSLRNLKGAAFPTWNYWCGCPPVAAEVVPFLHLCFFTLFAASFLFLFHKFLQYVFFRLQSSLFELL